MEGHVRQRVLVSGKVQGVWFRDSCQDHARQHGLVGWVRNLPDLRVEAAFEGKPEAVDALVAWCRQGPPRAQVHHVEVHQETPQGDRDFEVLW